MRFKIALFTPPVILMLAEMPMARASNTNLVSPRIGILSSEGFCANGVYRGTTWVEPQPPPDIHTWGSYCSERDSGKGILITSSFRAPSVLRLYLAGYPTNSGVSLRIEKPFDGTSFLIWPSREPHENWRLNEFSLPPSWLNSPVRLVAQDEKNGPGGWIALSEPVETKDADFEISIRLLLSTVVHFILLVLPGFAACAWAVYRGIRSVITAGVVLLAGIGASGYLAFWFYFIHPRLGYILELLLPVGAGILLMWITPRLDPNAGKLVKVLIPPVMLIGAGALLVLATGFLYGGTQDALHTASVRFSHPLPSDNTLPYLFAKALRDGHVPRPLFLDWLTSDRPPLQSGLVLSQAPFGHPGQIGYTVISVIAQSLWIFGLWLLLLARRTKRNLRALVVVTCLLSGFIFLNSFFVWPKLLAAAFTLGFLTVLFCKESPSSPAEIRIQFTTAGALLALGLLSHGGTVFAVIGATLVVLVRRRRLPLASFALMIGTSAAIYLPWFLYQKFVDPPGDRLIKLHLAGVQQVDPRSAIQAISSAYGNLTAHGWIHNKATNIDKVLGHEFDQGRSLGRIVLRLVNGSANPAFLLSLAANARSNAFFYFIPCLGLLPLGFVSFLAGAWNRYRTREWKTSAIFFLVVGFSLCDWCLIQFGPGTTIVHQGAYAVNLLAAAGCILALWALSPRLAVVVSALQVALNVLLYVILTRGFIPGGPLPEGYLHRGMLALCLLALGAVTYVSMLIAKDTSAERPRSAEPGACELSPAEPRFPSSG